ncbi:hypothetical protein PPL_11437 [Heterostelium album PN500]|uniref:Ankyrin repeat protein n=1 Tax=Heterostelium pallidum (strain ATCC 26659 / Pp 5 / PN500) TaxID=670386 RepID=D3BTE3_HETP5|nr:hypothetical protein PPL_11437 [Heterostelium album PN500]EFA75360.1 hypothetical protein PPL_11437 [Heterostelium album PN500]|eukprot:XP_020427494.1 hypothetical protein PPL_11437 [Heterostelium album PN500]
MDKQIFLKIFKNIYLCKYIFRYVNEDYLYRFSVTAARYNNFSILQWLHNRKEKREDVSLKKGNDWIKRYREKAEIYIYSPMYWAIRNGNQQMLTWLHENRTEAVTYHCYKKSFSQDSEILRWLLVNRQKDIRKLNIVSIMAPLFDVNDHVNLEWVLKNMEFTMSELSRMETYLYPFLESASESVAIFEQHLSMKRPTSFNLSVEERQDVLRFLNKGRRNKSKAMNSAATEGNLTALKWLHQNKSGYRTSTLAMNGAAANGHFDCVIWLHSNRSEGCTLKSMNKAAGNGHSEIVKWLHSNRTEGCSRIAMNKAAENGHLEILIWLHEHRTEGFSARAINGASSNGHLSVLKWFHENINHNVMQGFSAKTMDKAIRNNHFEVVKWLHENRTEGCTEAGVELAAKLKDMSILWWLHKNMDIPFTEKVLRNGIKSHQRTKVKWLYENRSEFQTIESIKIIFEHLFNKDSSNNVQWMVENISFSKDRLESIKKELFSKYPNATNSIIVFENLLK